MSVVFLNGEFIEKDEAKVSIFDRGFLLGDGIYEVLPVVDSRLVDVDGFWERFQRSTSEIKLELSMSKDEYINMFYKLIKENNMKEGGVYTQITRGVADREFNFTKNLKPTCMAFVFEKKVIDNPKLKTGIKVVSVKDLRWKRRDIKSISLLAQCMAKENAHENGADEGFMIENGFVTEGVSSTAYIIKNKTIITPPLSNSILPGVRRKNLLNIIKDLGYALEERHFSIDEAKKADEVFISAATLIILPVVQIDGFEINGGKVGSITMILRNEYVKRIYKQLNS